MDLETENRIAAILLKEAAELRQQAEREGVNAYVRQPTARSRPNSRFLTATVLGVQQANRAVEVNEMWRLRQKEIELDNRLKGRRNESSSGRSRRDACDTPRSTSYDNEPNTSDSYSSKKRVIRENQPMEGDGLKDDEMEEFLHSRIKRGRGAVGSRMDETGPYLPSCADSKQKQSACSNEELWKDCVLLGPEKLFSLKSDDESLPDKKKKSKSKMLGSGKRCSRKHKSKETSKDKKRKRRVDKKSKHQK